MVSLYNKIASQSLERVASLSDGIFAFAMTVLVLDLRLPAPETIHSEPQLWHAMIQLSPQIVMCLMSFLSLGIFWNAQQTQMNFMVRSDRNFHWIHLLFLFAVVLVPFSTKLLAAFIAYRLALAVYWLNIFLIGVVLYSSWRYVGRAGLVKEDVSKEIRRAISERIITAQSLYALGALLCFISTRWSIGFILSVQLYYAVAPHRRRFNPALPHRE